MKYEKETQRTICVFKFYRLYTSRKTKYFCEAFVIYIGCLSDYFYLHITQPKIFRKYP